MSIHPKALLVFYFSIQLLFLAIPVWVKGQTSCASCTPTTTYTALGGFTEVLAQTINNTNNTDWNSNFPTTSGIARFYNFNPLVTRFYKWETPGGGTIAIAGLVVESGVFLTLDRNSTNSTDAFDIVGGCIVIKSGATLDLQYLTELRNVNICVEAGGTIKFDSRREDQNYFTFNNVNINLQDETSKIILGEMDPVFSGGGLVIDGWTGPESDLCENSTPSIPGSSGNITWTSAIELSDLCEILNGGRILPVEFTYLNSRFNETERTVEIQWQVTKGLENASFEIERSANGKDEWDIIGQILGKGTSVTTQEYTFTDSILPLGGGSIFYRIRQVHLNYEPNLSKVIGVQIPSIESIKGAWRAYPNPTDGSNFRVDILRPSEYEDESIQFRLIGNFLNFEVKQASTIEELNEQLLPLVRSSNPGVYVLEIRWGEKIEQIKIWKK